MRDRSGCCSHLFVCTRPSGCASCPLTAHSFSCHPLSVAPSFFLPPHAVTLLTGSIIQRPGWGFHTALTPPTLTHTRSASTHTHSPSVTQTPTPLRNTRLFSSSRFYLANTCPFLHFPPLPSHIYNNKNKSSLVKVLHSTFTSAMCDMSVSLKCVFVLFDHDAGLGGQMSQRDVIGGHQFSSDVTGQ